MTTTQYTVICFLFISLLAGHVHASNAEKLQIGITNSLNNDINDYNESIEQYINFEGDYLLNEHAASPGERYAKTSVFFRCNFNFFYII